MLRLLRDCQNAATGAVEVEYAQQWSTLCKAHRLGYIDDGHRLTEAGRTWLARQQSK